MVIGYRGVRTGESRRECVSRWVDCVQEGDGGRERLSLQVVNNA